MLVSHEHKFIFLKTRKVAGTSIEMFLQPLCAEASDYGNKIDEKTNALVGEKGIVGSRLIPKNMRSGLNAVWWNHMPANEIKNLIGPVKWNSYEKITALRNPYDRMISLFLWRRRRAKNVARQNPDLVEGFKEFVTQKPWPDDYDVTHLSGKFAADRIIRFESLADDLKKLTNNLGLQLETKHLPTTKVSPSKKAVLSAKQFFSSELLEVVNDRLGWMFEHGGYSKSITPHDMHRETQE